MAVATIDTHENGISHARAILGCPKRYYCERDLEGDGGPDAAFGTALHAWTANYHWGTSDTIELLNPEAEARTCSELQLAQRYARRFTADGLGEALLVEEHLSMQVKGARFREPFAGTLDAIVKISPACAAQIYRERNIIIEPGKWLVDHKTKRQKSSTLVPQYLADPQFTGYHMLAQEHGYGPLRGTLVNLMFRYKDDRDEGFMTLMVGPPSTDAINAWASIVRDAQQRLRTLGPQWKNPVHCFDYGRICPCFYDCDRSNLEVPLA